MNARITTQALSNRLDSVESKLDRLIAALEPKAPAKTVTRRVNTTKAKAQPKAAKALCKSTRLAFIAAAKREGYDFTGCSTKVIASECVAMGYAPKGFRIGAGYTAMFSA